MSARRRRGIVLLCLAVACGGLAASQVRSSTQRLEAQIGRPVPVVVAGQRLAADTKLGPRAAERSLALRQVPERFAPPDALASIDEAVGLRTSAPVAAGAYLTAAHLQLGEGAQGGGGSPLERGQRLMEVAVAGGDPLAGAGPGARVDVLVTTETGAGGGRTYVALEDVELVAAGPAEGPLDGGGGEGPSRASAMASLRVTARQAIFLTSAQNFAREIRLLVRPPGDRTRVGAESVESGAL